MWSAKLGFAYTYVNKVSVKPMHRLKNPSDYKSE